MIKYDFSKIEKKWQKYWLAKKIYEPDLKKAKKPFYNLMMFPYPSAEGLHVGNMYAFVGSDIYGRLKRMQGYDVFEPIGLDGFGIHSENYALKIGAHPMKQSKVSEKRFYDQLENIGNGFAWAEKLETYDPAYYKWTQWIFIQLFKNGLAYRKKAAVNWCPSCKTVLADEQVIAGKCERCGTVVVKKELEQWFFKITKYADKLLKNIEKIDWSERVKIAQRNWIGKSEGAIIKFPLRGIKGQPDDKHSVEVFTTRPDTLYGATFMAVSPELAKAWLDVGWQVKEEVKKYIEKALKNRTNEIQKEKTGVFTGIYAVNPVNKEEIPVWVSDYVLAGYGTGAIMAVPAHDERDWEFAKKFGLQVRQVIAPHIIDWGNPPREGKRHAPRTVVQAVVRHWKDDSVIQIVWKKQPWKTFVIGGAEEGESLEEAVRREVAEETGYKNFEYVRRLCHEMRCEWYADHKDENRYARMHVFEVKLKDGDHDKLSPEEAEKHEVVWVPVKSVADSYGPVSELQAIVEGLSGKSSDSPYEGEGVLIDSGKFSEMKSAEAKKKIAESVGGKTEITYRLRDWLISRQRYWGVPIPMIFCEKCSWQSVPEKNLPVKLPFVKDFRPKGRGVSPLASVKSFYEIKCPQCGGPARRETDVSDTFLDSAWYYIGYLNLKKPFDKAAMKEWLPVNMYIGGVEHSVLHLLYSRFLTMALKDMGFVHFEEPFTKFRAHGLLIKEGGKMSKSKGNIVNPDEYIKKFGADTLRMYLMFLAPFEQGGDFRDAGILGMERFLKRIQSFSPTNDDKPRVEKALHQTIKKVTTDIESLHYNTAVSALMILLNVFEREGASGAQFAVFLKLLSLFAPHLTEELWQVKIGHKTSIHREAWPAYDSKLIEEENFDLVIQVNGKHRATISLRRGVDENEAKRVALAEEKIKKVVVPANIKKTVFVKDRLINFVL